MADYEQLSLEVAQAAPQPAQPDDVLADIQDPTLTPEQNERYDRLVENGGFNRVQALRAVGALPVSHETRTEPDAEATPTQVGPVIVDPAGLPKNARFGMWDNEH